MAHGDINPDGSIAFTANQSMGGFDLTNVGGLQAGAGADITIKLGDAAGANKVSITDSADAEIFNIDSDGNVKVLNALSIYDPTGAEAVSITRSLSTILLNGDVGGGATNFRFRVAGYDALTIYGASMTVKAMSPIVTSAYDIGTSSLVFKDIHAEQIILYDDTGVENGTIVRNLTALQIDSGTGGTLKFYVAGVEKISATGGACYLSNTEIILTGLTRPGVSSTYDIGSATYVWKDIHSERILLYDDTGAENAIIIRDLTSLKIDSGTGGDFRLYHAGAIVLQTTGTIISFYDNLSGYTDSAIDLGSSGAYFNDGYIDDIYTEGLHIQNAGHTEQADITRDDNYLQISGGTGCAAVTIGAVSTDPRIYIYDTSIQPKRDFYPTSDNVYDVGSPSRRFAEGHFVDTYFSSLYPTEIAQAAEPTLASGQMRVWRDTDDNSIWLVYNNPTAGQKKVQMT